MDGFQALKQAAEMLEEVAEDLALPGISNRLSTAARCARSCGYAALGVGHVGAAGRESSLPGLSRPAFPSCVRPAQLASSYAMGTRMSCGVASVTGCGLK